MKTYLGEDEGDADQIDEHSPGGIVIETLGDIRTVASLTLEKSRAKEYAEALANEDPHPIRTKIIKGSGSGLGQFTQMWGFGLMQVETALFVVSLPLKTLTIFIWAAQVLFRRMAIG